MVVDVVKSNQFAIRQNGAMYSVVPLLSDQPNVTFCRNGQSVKMTISVEFIPDIMGDGGANPSDITIPNDEIERNVFDFNTNTWASGTMQLESGLSNEMAKIRITTDNLITNALKGKFSSAFASANGKEKDAEEIA